MKNNLNKILWGGLLIAAGIGFAGNEFDIWNFNIFFSGWWTLFLIIPAIISVIQNGINAGNIIPLTIGAVFLLSAQGVISGSVISRLFFPAILVLIGFSIIFGGRKARKRAATNPHLSGEPRNGKFESYCAIFSGRDAKLSNADFFGADASAVFGGVTIDLRDAIIVDGAVISASAIFGGIDIYVPANVNVQLSCTPIFGGATNNASSNLENSPTLYVNATCAFGGLDIK